jgi:hypothetical protein
MCRPKLFLASPSPCVAEALCRTLGAFVPSTALPHQLEPLPFRHNSELIEGLSRESSLDAMALLDLTDAGLARQAWQTGAGGPLGVAAEVVLRFPEIYFVFLERRETARESLQEALGRDAKSPALQESWDVLVEHHFLEADELVGGLFRRAMLHRNGFRTLFDATRLRNALKHLLITDRQLGLSSRYLADCLARLGRCASATDEERSFHYLNGYAAYKAGYATWLCGTAAETRRVHQLGQSPEAAVPEPAAAPRQGIPNRFHLFLTDFDLQFADMTGGDRLAGRPPVGTSVRDLARWVSDNRHALIVELLRRGSGHETEGGFYVITGDCPAASRMLDLMSLKGSCHDIVSKPYEGLFRLLAPRVHPNDPTRRPLAEAYRAIRARRRGGNSPGPAEDGTAKGTASGEHHSVPFAIGLVAGALLGRTARLAGNGGSAVESWVLAATLSLEAKELLAGLGTTMYFEALARQQEAEVAAEALFFGVAATLRVRERLDDFGEELELFSGENGRGPAGPCRGASHRELATWNCALQTVNNLRVRLMEQEQFEAAEECLREMKTLERKIERSQLWPEERDGERQAPPGGAPGTPQPAPPPAAPPGPTPGPVRRSLRWIGRRLRWVGRSRLLRVPRDACRGLKECWLVFRSPGGRGSWLDRAYRRCKLLGTGYLDSVTAGGTSVFRLLEVNLWWVVLFGLFFWPYSSWVWTMGADSSWSASLSLQGLFLSLLHSAMNFFNMPSTLDGYIKHASFTTVNPHYYGYLCISLLEVLIAYVHLGLLVALLYRKMTRSA